MNHRILTILIDMFKCFNSRTYKHPQNIQLIALVVNLINSHFIILEKGIRVLPLSLMIIIIIIPCKVFDYLDFNSKKEL